MRRLCALVHSLLSVAVVGLVVALVLSSLALRWRFAGASLAPRWRLAGASLAPRWRLAGACRSQIKRGSVHDTPAGPPAESRATNRRLSQPLLGAGPGTPHKRVHSSVVRAADRRSAGPCGAIAKKTQRC